MGFIPTRVKPVKGSHFYKQTLFRDSQSMIIQSQKLKMCTLPSPNLCEVSKLISDIVLSAARGLLTSYAHNKSAV